MVMLVFPKVLGQIADALGKQRHLNLGGTGIAVMGTEFGDYFLGGSHILTCLGHPEAYLLRFGNRIIIHAVKGQR